VPVASWFQYAYLAYVAQPKPERELYRRIKARRVVRIVEVGIGNVMRATRLIAVAQRFAGEQKVSYTGLDWFDARSTHLPPLSLKQAYRALHATAGEIRLVPGPPGASLASAANSHLNTGLLIFSQAVSDDELSRAWFYVPRMLSDQSIVVREQIDAEGQPLLVLLSASELAERAGRCAPPRRVA
jgi:hypothetical protein